MILENIQSYINTSIQSTETFDEHYINYMMKVQDEQLNEEMNHIFGTSLQRLVEIDREVDKLHTTAMRGE